MRKKLTVLLVVFALILTLGACGSPAKNKVDYTGTWIMIALEQTTKDEKSLIAVERGDNPDKMLFKVEEGGKLIDPADDSNSGSWKEIEGGIEATDTDGKIINFKYNDGVMSFDTEVDGVPTTYYIVKKDTEPSAKEKEIYATANQVIMNDGTLKENKK